MEIQFTKFKIDFLSQKNEEEEEKKTKESLFLELKDDGFP